jgi:glycerophosphoryl diester phosphodiesterase family protein
VPIAIAHRAPASAAQCARLVALGASVFEVDVQLIDGVLVSSHFLPALAALPRLRRDGLRITHRRRDPREIALSAAVARIPRPAQIMLDLKTDSGAAAEALVAAVTAADLEPGRFIVCTKGWHTLATLRAHGFPTWRTVADSSALGEALRLGAIPDVAVTVAHRLLTSAVVNALHATGTQVMTWTVNDVARARALVEAGVDGVTSDDPEVIRAVAAAPGRTA